MIRLEVIAFLVGVDGRDGHPTGQAPEGAVGDADVEGDFPLNSARDPKWNYHPGREHARSQLADGV